MYELQYKYINYICKPVAYHRVLSLFQAFSYLGRSARKRRSEIKERGLVQGASERSVDSHAALLPYCAIFCAAPNYPNACKRLTWAKLKTYITISLGAATQPCFLSAEKPFMKTAVSLVIYGRPFADVFVSPGERLVHQLFKFGLSAMRSLRSYLQGNRLVTNHELSSCLWYALKIISFKKWKCK